MAVFLTENGVLSMGNKTPVTILQETLQKQGINPHYELIFNGTGTMDPIFKYRVSAKGFTAVGEGKSKKEAKHDAAAILLKRMQPNRAVVENEADVGQQEVDIASPYTGALKQNFVGMLDEVSVINKIPLPEFIPVSEHGPPHARIFTMECNISSCTETAVARTKKQAKHMAAQQMLARIANILGDKFIPVTENSTENNESLESMNLKAIESGSFRHDLSIPISDTHNIFYHRAEEFLIPQTFLDLSSKSEEFYENMEKPKEFLDELLHGLEGTSKVVLAPANILMEALAETEHLSQMFWWGLDDDSSVEENSEEYTLDESEINLLSEKYVLEEFDLGSEEETSVELPRQIEEKKPECETLENDICDKQSNDVDTVTCEKVLVDNDASLPLKTNGTVVNGLVSKPVHLFLSTVCPQGSWSFYGRGGSESEAVDNAAVQALKFFRIMSVPTKTKTATEKTGVNRQ